MVQCLQGRKIARAVLCLSLIHIYAIFTENGLNELCDYGVDESLIRKISKRSGIPYADPDEPDEEIPLKEAQPKLSLIHI